MPITSSTPAVFVVGLPTQFRGEGLESQLRDMSLTPTRVDGVMFRELPAGEFPVVDQSRARVLLKRELTDGEIGCALAHRAVAEALLRSDRNYALVFEDDAKIVDVDAFSSVLAASAEHLARDGAEPRVRVLYSQAFGLVLAGQTWTDGQTGVRDCHTAPHATTGYLINRSAARLLVSNTSPVTYVADWPPGLFSGARFDAAVPWSVRPDETKESTLAADREPGAGIVRDRALRKFLRHVRAATCITYLRHRDAFTSFRAYAHHEVGRHVWRMFAARGRRRVSVGDSTLPVVGRVDVTRDGARLR